MRKPELLMPGGNLLQAATALENGADAVYVGGPAFNARLRAQNLKLEEIAGLVKHAENGGKRVFATMNTLVRDTAFENALSFLEDLYSTGAHGVIVQDLGLMHAATQLFPDWRVHASTQCTAHNSAGVRFLESVGAKRVILARELSLDEISGIRKHAKCELESFVHGALCYSLSGQCLFSSFAFRRSANQGMCAQPCRLYYSSKDREGFLLSLNDLFLGADAAKLFGLVDSLKVEGRLKSAEYAGAVARFYRKVIDGIELTRQDYDDVFLAYNRGFSKGYFDGTPGFSKYPYSLGLPAGNTDERGALMLEARIAVGDILSIAGRERRDFVVQRMSVDGHGTVVAAAGKARFDFPLPPNSKVFLTQSKSLSRLLAKRLPLPAKPARPLPAGYAAARCKFLDEPKKYPKAPFSEKQALHFASGKLEPLGFADTLPFMTDAEVDAMPKKVFARNLGAYEACTECVAGPELNISNRYSARLLPKAQFIVPSLELTRRELVSLAEYAPLALYVYGRVRLTVSRSPAPRPLSDRKGFQYETEKRGGLYYVYNPFPLSLLGEKKKFGNSAIRALLFEKMDSYAREFLARGESKVPRATKGWF